MKKLLSISFALLILLSGMNIAVITHICSGKITDVKWSLSVDEVSCGMEATPSGNNSISTRCCENNISVYSVDENYNLSSFQIKEATKEFIQVFNIPVKFAGLFLPEHTLFNSSPPNLDQTSDVSLAEIRVFRI